jgi:hypothetical protein
MKINKEGETMKPISHKTKYFMILLNLAFYSPVFANSGSESVDYIRLRNLFELASGPISLNDFDKSEQSSNLKCSAIEDPSSLASPLNDVPKIYTYTVKEGRPAEGPLLPAVPPTTASVILIQSPAKADPTNNKASDDFAKQMKMSMTDREIIVAGDENESEGVESVKISYRKQKDLITFKQVTSAGTDKENTMYGYCWHQTVVCTFKSAQPSPFLKWTIAYDPSVEEGAAKDTLVITDGARFQVVRDDVDFVRHLNGEGLKILSYEARLISQGASQIGVKHGSIALVNSLLMIPKSTNQGQSFSCK